MIRTGLLSGDNENASEYFSGILIGVEGRRGLVSPLFGLNGCGNERLGLPKGEVTGLACGVLGVKVNVSELSSDRRNVGLPHNIISGLPGGSNFPFESI